MGRTRRRIIDERQLELPLADHDFRVCREVTHRGDRVMPADSFPLNGRFRRNTCKTCWARAQREREVRNKHTHQQDTSLVAMLHKLWRPTRTV